jgi:hypothetical protein
MTVGCLDLGESNTYVLNGCGEQAMAASCTAPSQMHPSSLFRSMTRIFMNMSANVGHRVRIHGDLFYQNTPEHRLELHITSIKKLSGRH